MVGLKGETSSRSKTLITEQKRLCLPSGEMVEFEQFGKNPKSLFISGNHGDETGVIGRLRSQLNRTVVFYPKLLSNLLRVFQPYPESISAGTRGVVSGAKMDDLERSFSKPGEGEITHPRAVLLAELLKNYPDIVLTGIDDFELQIEIEDGYKLTPAADFEVGDFDTYAVETGRIGKSKIKRAFFLKSRPI